MNANSADLPSDSQVWTHTTRDSSTHVHVHVPVHVYAPLKPRECWFSIYMCSCTCTCTHVHVLCSQCLMCSTGWVIVAFVHRTVLHIWQPPSRDHKYMYNVQTFCLSVAVAHWQCLCSVTAINLSVPLQQIHVVVNLSWL